MLRRTVTFLLRESHQIRQKWCVIAKRMNPFGGYAYAAANSAVVQHPVSSAICAPAVIPWMVRELDRGTYRVRIPPVITKDAVVLVPGCFGPTPRDRDFFRKTGVKGGAMENALGFLPIPSKMVKQPSISEFVGLVRYILTLPDSLKPPVCEGHIKKSAWESFFGKINLADTLASSREAATILSGGQSQWCPLYIKYIEAPSQGELYGQGQGEICNRGLQNAKPKTMMKPDKPRIIAAMKKNAPEICGQFDDMLLSEGAETVVGVAHSLGALAWGEYVFNHSPKVNVVHSILASAPILKEVLEEGIRYPYISVTNLLCADDRLLDVVLETSIEETRKALSAHGLINVHVKRLKGCEHNLPIEPIERIVAAALDRKIRHMAIG